MKITCYNLVGREWFSGISLDPNAGEIDVGVIHTLWNRFLAATLPSPTFNISLNLDTNKVYPLFSIFINQDSFSGETFLGSWLHIQSKRTVSLANRDDS